MMWWFDSNKTKPNKTKNQAPSFLQEWQTNGGKPIVTVIFKN